MKNKRNALAQCIIIFPTNAHEMDDIGLFDNEIVARDRNSEKVTNAFSKLFLEEFKRLSDHEFVHEILISDKSFCVFAPFLRFHHSLSDDLN